MTVQEIKTAVDSGKTVHWSTSLYTVIKDSKGQYLIKSGSHYIGLTWSDGVTLNGKEEQFFIAQPKTEAIVMIQPGYYPLGAMAFPLKGEYVILSQGEQDWSLWYSQIDIGTDLQTVDYGSLETQGSGFCGTFDELFFEHLIELYSVKELDTMLDNLYEKTIGYRPIEEGETTRDTIKILLEHGVESNNTF